VKKKHHIIIVRLRTGRFRFLLAAMVLVFILRPFLESSAGIDLLTDAFLALVTIAGIFGLTDERKGFFGALMIGLAVLTLQVASHYFHSYPVEMLKRVCYAVFFTYLLVVILSHIFRETEVTEDLITGAVCAYLLIGMVWTFVFYFLEQAKEGSFSMAGNSPRDIGVFFYYSFVTLATLGYGDIVPVTSPARSLGVLEALMGQLYLAITIARLVTVHASKPRKSRDEDVRSRRPDKG
jgi:hypothetical protein